MKHATTKMFRIALAAILVLLSTPLISSGQGNTVQVITIPDIAGDGAIHTVASAAAAYTSATSARWIQFIAAPSNSTTNCGTSAVSGCVRFGDSNISTSRGFMLQPGVGIPLGESASTMRQSLANTYYLVQSGDKLTIILGL